MSRQDVNEEVAEETAKKINPTDADEAVGSAAEEAAAGTADTSAKDDAGTSAEAPADGTADAAQDDASEEAKEDEEQTDGAQKTAGSADSGDSTDSTDSTAGEKSGFFNRKKKKDKKDEQIEELTDRVKRTMAEFENFRKRNEREKSQMYEIGARDIIEKMLPVMDNFERGLASIPEDQKDNAVAQGMEMICKQMQTTFDQIGVKAIDAVGKEFDPNFHNAVMHEDNEEVGENIIVEEFQKGYTYRDTVIRHSMVKVAN